ncbi:MAG: AMP-binding protein [Proteobacteria bacterium]|nr:AMP-binding protein [Pseudomonadota bacterium]MBU2228343.1 AMP-binding protein [Pseudomonadota bacterium]MBU2262528.1 AMP-binding protein [Pseudomonadota bacterium]
MPREYKTYEEFRNNYKPSQRWEFFDGNKTNFNIAHECIDRHPKDKTAINIIFDDGHRETYTFGTLARLTSQFANTMEKLGIKQGDSIALAMNPSLEFYVSLHGILKVGAVVVACSPLFGTEAIEYRLNKSNAKMVIINESGKDLVKPGLVQRVITAEELMGLIEKEDEHYAPHTSLDTLAFMQFSSGTTGLPRAVQYHHRSVGVVAFRMKFFVGLRDTDNYFCPSSPAWGHGIWYGSVGPLIFGNAIGAYSGRFSAETLLNGLEEFEITNMYATPLIYRRIMETGKLTEYRLKLRRLTYTGGALDIDVIRYFQDKLGLVIQANYGSTETGGFLSDYAFDDWAPKPGSLGKPLPGVKVAILDEGGRELPPGKVGQIAIRYKEGGAWTKMGDAGYVDEDGYFWYKNRIDDIIISSGYTIGPIEIENVLLKHPAVKEVAIVGIPDKDRGEIVKAFIVTDREKNDALKQDIQDFVKTRLSRHEYPRVIEFVDELPTTPDGKIKRKELKLREYERAKKTM